MDTQLTPRALDVIADSGETGELPLRNAAPGSSGGGSAVERPRSLLRPVGSKPTVCYCPPGICQAPKGFSGPCNRAVDVHSLLRAGDAQKQARAEQLPTEQDCIRMMVQCRLRLIELGWREGEYAPRDGTEFTAINAGFTGPVTCVHLGSGYFVADGGDWWPTPRPIVFRPIAAAGERA